MKNLARLTIFFSLCFIIFFASSAVFRFLAFWIDAARVISLDYEQGGSIIAALRRALPASLFITILLSLSYSVRRKIHTFLSIFLIIVLSSLFTLGFSLGIERFRSMNPSLEAPNTIRARPGLILSRRDTAMVLLRESGDQNGPRVISFPERPLVYQESPLGPNNSMMTLPLNDRTPWFVQSILIDFSLTARELFSRLAKGLQSFCIYAGSLILLLASLHFVLELSTWPMANLFLGALAFRFILSLGIFLNARETIIFINTFLNGRIPDALIVPLVFCALALLILVYTLLVHLARRMVRRQDA